jgi:hypothetical protein
VDSVEGGGTKYNVPIDNNHPTRKKCLAQHPLEDLLAYSVIAGNYLPPLAKCYII